VLSIEVEINLAVEFYAVTPNSFEHAQCFGDVFLVWVCLHIVLFKVFVET